MLLVVIVVVLIVVVVVVVDIVAVVVVLVDIVVSPAFASFPRLYVAISNLYSYISMETMLTCEKASSDKGGGPRLKNLLVWRG